MPYALAQEAEEVKAPAEQPAQDAAPQENPASAETPASSSDEASAEDRQEEEPSSKIPTFSPLSSEEGRVSEKILANEDLAPPPGKIDLDRRITLDLRSMEVVEALKYIGLRSGINIVTSKAVTGSVTFQLKNVPLKDILDITLLSNGLAYEKRGEIYYVMPEKEYQERFGKSFSDARQVRMYHLQYAIPQKAFDLLDTLKSTVGRILVDQESGTVMMMDTPEKLAAMEEALGNLERKNDVNVFNLEYATAKEMEDQLKVHITDKNVGFVKADERSNQVVVQTLPGRMGDVQQIISALDKKTKEVLIDAKIIKISLTNALDAEFSWEGMFNSLTKGTKGATQFLGNHPLSPVFRTGQQFIDDSTSVAATANPPAGQKSALTESIYLGATTSDDSYEAFIKYLKTIGETKLLSNPKLAVINKQEARIHIGRKEAYVTTTTTTGQTTTTTAEDVTFVDIGIQLAVTPTINEEGYVTLKIKPEVSSVVDILETPSGNKIPIIDTSTAETTVMVKDNTTIIIGGLRREDETLADKRVPFLGDIPIFGFFFRSSTKTKEHSELLVMITPHIIEGNMLTTGGELEYEKASSGMKPFKGDDEYDPTKEEAPGELQLKPYRD